MNLCTQLTSRQYSKVPAIFFFFFFFLFFNTEAQQNIFWSIVLLVLRMGAGILFHVMAPKWEKLLGWCLPMCKLFSLVPRVLCV